LCQSKLGIEMSEVSKPLVGEVNAHSAVVAQQAHIHDIRVGGEGGLLGGGGGEGGVLNIYGTTRIPPDTSFDGEDGRAPGAGGGGGGAAALIGRPIDSDDVANGVRVSNIMLANSASYSGPLFNVLGGGWTFLPVPQVQTRVRIILVVTVELGRVAPNTLLRLDIDVVAPDESRTVTQSCDIEVPTDLVPRSSIIQMIDFDVTAFGVWQIVLHSLGRKLASLEFECRHQ
jgi:hypothetical protein